MSESQYRKRINEINSMNISENIKSKLISQVMNNLKFLKKILYSSEIVPEKIFGVMSYLTNIKQIEMMPQRI